MKFVKILIIFVIVAGVGFGAYMFGAKKQSTNTLNPTPTQTSLPSTTLTQAPISPTQTTQISPSPTVAPDTASEIAAFLAKKYNKPLSEVHVTVTKEVQGYASGSVLFGEGGPGEGGMWLAVLGNDWQVVWDGNGNVDCEKMRKDGFPDTILKPNFCD